MNKIVNDNYHFLAHYYDQLLSDDETLTSWMRDFVAKVNGNDILDVATGSGNCAIMLNSWGYNVEAFDLSQDMIEVAKLKNDEIDFKVMNYLNFKYDKSFDGILCIMDSLNYINNLDDFRNVLTNFYDHLNINGVLMFDYHATSRLSEFKDGYIEENTIDDIDYQWTINSENNALIQQFIFWKDGDVYKESHQQFIFDINDIKDIMQAIGFTVEINNIEDEKHMVWGYKK